MARPLSKPPGPLASPPAPDPVPRRSASKGASLASPARSLPRLGAPARPGERTAAGSRAKSAGPPPTGAQRDDAEVEDEDDDDVLEDEAVEEALRAHEDFVRLLKRRAETALARTREPHRRSAAR